MNIGGIYKAGFYPYPPHALALTTQLITATAGAPLRLLDPCAGEGAALAALAASLKAGGGKPTTYGVELADTRAAAAATVLDQVVKADWFDVSLSTASMSLLWCNPPYDFDVPAELQPTKRLEYTFLRSSYDRLMPGGLLVYIVPRWALAIREVARLLAGHFTRHAVYAVPEYEQYKQIVLFAVRRPKAVPDGNAEALLKGFAATMPPALATATETYELPVVDLEKRFVFYKNTLTPAEERDLACQYGVLGTPAWQETVRQPQRVEFTPAVPMRRGHVAMLVASGLLGTLTLSDTLARGHAIKVYKETKPVKGEDQPGEEDPDKVVEREQFITKVFTFDRQGQFGAVASHADLETFLTTHATAIAALIEARHKPLYAKPAAALWAKLGALLPTKRLPGRSGAGLLDAQKHVALAAAVTIQERGHANVVADMGFGKCVREGTLVPTERGLLPIEELLPAAPAGFSPLRMSVQSLDGARTTSHFYKSGLRPTRKITTHMGFQVTGTLVHPVLVLDANGEKVWKRLVEVQVGDYVAVQRHGAVWGQETDLPSFEFKPKPSTSNLIQPQLPTQMSPDLAYLLGLLVGDGGLTPERGIDFTTADPELSQTFMENMASFGLHVGREGRLGHRVHSQVLKAWLDAIGLKAVLSIQKQVPFTIMRAPEPCVRAFLSGLVDTDGCGLKNDGVEYSTTSETLARQVHLLLLQFGIVARLRRRENAQAGAWILTMFGAEARRLYARIGFRLARKQARADLLPAKSNPNLDVIPHLPPFTFNSVPRAFGMYIRRLQAPSYAKLQQMAAHYPELTTLLAPEFFWDCVDVTQDEGLQPCYDLTVPETHSFVTNGIVSHNTATALATAVALDAWPALVLCPPHLVEKWAREVTDVVPDATATVLTSVKDTAAFAAGHQAGTKAVAILSREDAKLGSGWRPATRLKQQRIVDEDGVAGWQTVHTCPRCWQIVTDADGVPLTDMPAKRSFCLACQEPLYQYTRYSHKQTSKARWPVARYVRDHVGGFFKLLIADEVHQYKGKGTDQGAAFQDLICACQATLTLTGTIFGGKSVDLFRLLYRLDGTVRAAYQFNDENRWSKRYGRLERTTKKYTSDADGRSGNTRYFERVTEIPGVSPLIVERVLPTLIFARIADLGYALPPLTEQVVRLELTPDQAKQYTWLDHTLLELYRAAKADGDRGLLSVWLQNVLARPNSGFREEAVVRGLGGTGKQRIVVPVEALQEGPAGTKPYPIVLPPVLPASGWLPKEAWLTSFVQSEVAQGRKVLVYARQTGMRDIQPRLQATLARTGVRALILPDSIDARKREAWITAHMPSMDALITNPRKVETGLDLVQFATVVFYEIEYSLTSFWQAMRRVWRLGQTQPVKVVYAVYKGTLEEAGLALMGQKFKAAAMLYGDNAASAISAEADDSGGDFLAELAARVLANEKLTTDGLTGLLGGSKSTGDAWGSFTQPSPQLSWIMQFLVRAGLASNTPLAKVVQATRRRAYLPPPEQGRLFEL